MFWQFHKAVADGDVKASVDVSANQKPSQTSAAVAAAQEAYVPLNPASLDYSSAKTATVAETSPSIARADPSSAARPNTPPQATMVGGLPVVDDYVVPDIPSEMRQSSAEPASRFFRNSADRLASARARNRLSNAHTPNTSLDRSPKPSPFKGDSTYDDGAETPPQRTPRQSPAKFVMSQSALRSRSRSDSVGRSPTPPPQPLLADHHEVHHVDTHREDLTAVVRGLRTRAKISSNFAATLRGQIREIDGLIADAERPNSEGLFKPESLRSQRAVWLQQLVDFVASSNTHAAIHLTSLPPRFEHFKHAESPSAAVSTSAVVPPQSTDVSGSDADASGPSSSVQQSGNRPRPKILRRGDGAKRYEDGPSKRKAEEEAKEREEAAKIIGHPSRRSASGTRVGHAERSVSPGSRLISTSRSPSTDSQPSPSEKAAAAQKAKLDTSLSKVAALATKPKRTPSRVGARTGAGSSTNSSTVASMVGRPSNGGKKLVTVPMHSSSAAQRRTEDIAHHVATVVSSGSEHAPHALEDGRVSLKFLNHRRAQFLQSMFPDSAEEDSLGFSRQRLTHHGSFFDVYDANRYHATRDAIMAVAAE